MQNYKKISKITLWCLMAVGIVVSILFYAGGNQGSLEVAGDFLDIPRFSTLFLVWNYILVACACLVTLGIIIYEFCKALKADKKAALTKLGVVVGFICLVVLCWVLGSSEEVKILGYEGTDNVGGMAKLSDAMLYLSYTLVVATVVALIWGIIHTKRLK